MSALGAWRVPPCGRARPWTDGGWQNMSRSGLVPQLDQPLLRVPAEKLSASCRSSQRRIEKELSAIISDICALGRESGDAGPLGRGDAKRALGDLVGRLQGLKRKVDDGRVEQEEHVRRCKHRLAHVCLLDMTSASTPEGAHLAQQRTDWLLTDWCHRQGLTVAADALTDAGELHGLVDAEVFAEAREILAALRRRDCAPALGWASDNRARLRRHKSSLEFRLRLQEFVETVRRGEKGAAIAYARTHFPPHSSAHMGEIQRAMATAAFPDAAAAAAAGSAYASLFADGAWAELERQFSHDHRALHCAPQHAPLLLALATGLAALKTPTCAAAGGGGGGYDGLRARACPACCTELRDLSTRLPLAHHTRSMLLCASTGREMDEDNPPYVLPDGSVCSAAALGLLGAAVPRAESAAEPRDAAEAVVVDPRSGVAVRRSELRKAYIM